MSLKINQICLKCSLVTGFLLLLQHGIAQYDFSAADQLLQKNQKLLGNEVAALVWKDGKIIYQKALGQDFTIKTPAPVASCSKWLTAALVMTFVDEGKLSLDDPVGKYLPIFDRYAKSYVTIRQCLSHTTGIESDKGAIGKFLQRKKFESLEALVNSYAAKEISNNAGTEFHYGAIGPDIAARVAEVIGKKNFERLIQERILRPLKMKNTNFDNDGRAPSPSGGAVSTASDYLNFLIMILNRGTFEGKRILSEAAIAEMQKPQNGNVPVKYIPKIAEGYAYGLGEWIQEKDAAGNGMVVTSPGLFGTWPYVDNCHQYAAIIFVKTLITDARRDVVYQFKDIVDNQTGGCK